MTVLYAKKSAACGEIQRVISCFFQAFSASKMPLSSVAMVSRREPRCLGLATWVRFRMNAETLCCPSSFCVALSQSVHWHARFYIAALSIIFFLGFRQWQSRADRVVNLNTTIRLPLFWRTWTWALASSRPHVLAWHMGRYCSDCRASDSQISGFGFPDISKIQKKRRPHKRLFQGSCPWLTQTLVAINSESSRDSFQAFVHNHLKWLCCWIRIWAEALFLERSLI